MTSNTQKQELYIGPRSFEFKDKDIFYGREREASELLSLAIAHPVLLVYSQSGAGKTSLINARLKPDLQENGFEVLNIVRMQVPLPAIKMEAVDNIFIYKTLWNLTGAEVSDEELEKQTLSTYLIERTPKIDKDGFPVPRVIIFDQFEELFHLHADRWEDRKLFFVQVRNAIEQFENQPGLPPLWVIFSMREDYIAHLDQYALEMPGKMSTRYRLERLREEAALDAINGPLKNSSISFEQGVAEKLVGELLKVRVDTDTGERREVKGEFVEPVQLQLVCQSLLENLPPKVIKISQEHIDKFGNVDKTLSRFYDNVVQFAAQAGFVEERVLRDWFGKVLITPTGTRGTIYRGLDSTGGIPNDAVDILESKHIIRAEYRAGARWYELTHDRLIDPVSTSNKTFLLKDTRQYEAENDSQKAFRLFTQGEQAQERGDHENALQLFQEAQRIYHSIDDQRGQANILVSAGNIYLLQGKLHEAIKKLDEALTVFELVDDKWGVLNSLVKMAKIYEKLANTDEALKLRKQAIVEAAQASEDEEYTRRFFERLKREDNAFTEMQQEFVLERRKYLDVITRSSFINLSSPSPASIVRAAYSDRMAWLLAVMAKLTYFYFEDDMDQRVTLMSNLRTGNFRLLQTFANKQTNIYAFLAKNNEFAVLAFRAMEMEMRKRKDVVIDQMARAPVIDIRVHTGFRQAYESVAKDIEKSVALLSGLPLYITGYSLGGALATVATQQLERTPHIQEIIAACYTFGSPRVNNSQYDVEFKSPIYRVVNTMDIVPVIPLLSVGYIHIGDVRYLGRKDGEFRRSIPTIERTYLFLAASLRFFGSWEENHSINEYIRKLETIAEKRNPRFGQH